MHMELVYKLNWLCTNSLFVSLLDILAARKTTRSRITGKVLLDGQRKPDNFKCMSGYV